MRNLSMAHILPLKINYQKRIEFHTCSLTAPHTLFITLVGSLHRHLIKTEVIEKTSSIPDRILALKPYMESLADSLNNLSDGDSALLKGALGQGADTFWLRFFQNLINQKYPDYCPEELILWKETQDQDIQDEGRKLKGEIKDYLKKVVFTKLEEALGDKYENSISLLQNECTGRILKTIVDNDNDSVDNYDWKDFLEISEYKDLIDKYFTSYPEFAEAFSINIGAESFKTKKEKLAWISIIDIPKGKKHDSLTNADISKLWLIREHLAQFVSED